MLFILQNILHPVTQLINQISKGYKTHRVHKEQKGNYPGSGKRVLMQISSIHCIKEVTV